MCFPRRFTFPTPCNPDALIPGHKIPPTPIQSAPVEMGVVLQVLPCTEGAERCPSAQSAARADANLLDREKGALVRGMVRLLGATVNLTSDGAQGFGVDMGGSRREAAGVALSRSSEEVHPVGGPIPHETTVGCGSTGGEQCKIGGYSGQCRNSGVTGWMAVWDRRETAAAAGEFLQVVNMGAAAAYSDQWQGAECAKGGRAAATFSAAIRSLLQLWQHTTRMWRRARSAVGGHAVPILRLCRERLPLSAVSMLYTLSHSFWGAPGYKAPAEGADEWWKRDPAQRPSLMSFAGWRHRVGGVWGLLPQPSAALLTLSRVVPGVDWVMERLVRTAPVCVTSPISLETVE